MVNSFIIFALLLCVIKLSYQSNSALLLADVNVASPEFSPKLLNGSRFINGSPDLFGKNVTTRSDYVGAMKGSTVEIELNGEYYINHIQLRLYDFDYYFTIDVSQNYKDWKRILDRNSLPS